MALNARSGWKKLLTDEEEASLIEFLVGCASIGHAKSRSDVQAIAQQIARTHDPHVEVTKGWWDSFRKRHPEMMLRHAEPLSYARACANNPEVIGKYFDLLEDTLKVNGLTQSLVRFLTVMRLECHSYTNRQRSFHMWVKSTQMLLLLATKPRSLSWHAQVPADIAFRQ